MTTAGLRFGILVWTPARCLTPAFYSSCNAHLLPLPQQVYLISGLPLDLTGAALLRRAFAYGFVLNF